MRVKYIYKADKERCHLSDYPNFSASGSIYGMKKRYYGMDALLVRCGSWIYNVTSSPEIYFNEAH